MTRPVIYVFINKGLHMSTGKAAAQACHAVAMSVIASGAQETDWTDHQHRTIITLEANDETHLKNIYEYLTERGYPMQRVIDEGITEVEPMTWTALATEVLDKDDEDVQQALSSFKSYRDIIKVTTEFER